MRPAQYALQINRSVRTVQHWCNAGLLGRRVGGQWEIDPTEPPPVIERKRKIGRVRRPGRLMHFKRKPALAGQQ